MIEDLPPSVTSAIKPTYLSTDKHGSNPLNFGLFDLTDLVFAPRIPKPHNETFWGFGNAKDYDDNYIIKPTKFTNESRHKRRIKKIKKLENDNL